MPNPARKPTITKNILAVLNGRLYAVGGFDGSTGLNTAEVFKEKEKGS